MDTHTGRERDSFMSFLSSVYSVIYFKVMLLFLIDNIFKLLQLPHELKVMKMQFLRVESTKRISRLSLCLVTFDLKVSAKTCKCKVPQT